MKNATTTFVTCRMCHTVHAIEVDYDDLLRFDFGEKVQDCFPYLPAATRELLISHTCPKCWDSIFGSDEDEDEEELEEIDENYEVGFNPYEGCYDFDC